MLFQFLPFYQTFFFFLIAAYRSLPRQVPVARLAQPRRLQPRGARGRHRLRRRAVGVPGHELRLCVAGCVSVETGEARR